MNTVLATLKTGFVVVVATGVSACGVSQNYFAAMNLNDGPAPASASTPTPPSTGGSGGGTVGIGPVSTPIPVMSVPPSPSPSPSLVPVVQTFKPVLAVRGIECMMCHGVFGSNIVTDFGLGSGNFNPSTYPTPTFFAYGGATASGGGVENVYGDSRGSWQSAGAIMGTVIIPNYTVSASESEMMFGLNSATSLMTLLNTPNLPSSSSGLSQFAQPMSAQIMPQPSSSPIVTSDNITIGYPTEAQIDSLWPTTPVPSSSPAVAPVSGGMLSGLGADSTNSYITNTASTVTCQGDVVVIGTLFLNNLNVQTNSGGCRLYVSNSVFIQGPINYVNAPTGSYPNLQIASARAILMGFSLKRMGDAQQFTAGSDCDAASGAVRCANESILGSPSPAGGPWVRFPTYSDTRYNPSEGNINGYAATTFFDNLVLDGRKIGAANLMDAADPGAIALAEQANPTNSVTMPEYVITETTSDYTCVSPCSRVAINYSGLLLNAPHVHSRYGGTFSGVIIGEVGMLARNPSASSSGAVEQFVYDPAFDSITSLLPLLTSSPLNLTILNVSSP